MDYGGIIMGNVKHESISQGRGCHEFDYISLKTDMVKYLICNRSKIDSMFEVKTYNGEMENQSNNSKEDYLDMFKEPIEITYLDLEKLIDETELTKKQKYVLVKKMQGYSDIELGEILQCQPKAIYNTMNTICKKIENLNDYKWREWTEINGLVKISDHIKYKRCTKCQRDLRADRENFSPDKRKKDGLENACKSCRKKARNTINLNYVKKSTGKAV